MFPPKFSTFNPLNFGLTLGGAPWPTWAALGHPIAGCRTLALPVLEQSSQL